MEGAEASSCQATASEPYPLCVCRLVSRCPRCVNAELRHSVLLQPHDERNIYIYIFYKFIPKQCRERVKNGRVLTPPLPSSTPIKPPPPHQTSLTHNHTAFQVHNTSIELAELLVGSDPLAALEVYCRFPLKPVHQQTFDEALVAGGIVNILMKQQLYDHPQLGPDLMAYGKIMGLGTVIVQLNSQSIKAIFNIQMVLSYLMCFYNMQ